jgi:hypothetical protein
MRDRWFFYQDTAGLWKWARLDVLGSVLAHSGASFESRDRCVEHARSSGYDADRSPVLASAALSHPDPHASGSHI